MFKTFILGLGQLKNINITQLQFWMRLTASSVKARPKLSHRIPCEMHIQVSSLVQILLCATWLLLKTYLHECLLLLTGRNLKRIFVFTKKKKKMKIENSVQGLLCRGL